MKTTNLSPRNKILYKHDGGPGGFFHTFKLPAILLNLPRVLQPLPDYRCNISISLFFLTLLFSACLAFGITLGDKFTLLILFFEVVALILIFKDLKFKGVFSHQAVSGYGLKSRIRTIGSWAPSFTFSDAAKALPVIEQNLHPGFSVAPDLQSERIQELEAQVKRLTANEKKLKRQLTAAARITELGSTITDLEAVTQILINDLRDAVGVSLGFILTRSSPGGRLSILAASGPEANLISPDYHPNLTRGHYGRVARLRKTIVVSRQFDQAEFILRGVKYKSALLVPLIANEYLHGILVLADPGEFEFSPQMMQVVDIAASQLIGNLERHRTWEAQTKLVQSSTLLTSVQEPGILLKKLTQIANQVLSGQFSIGLIRDDQGEYLEQDGCAPLLCSSILSQKRIFYDLLFDKEGIRVIRDIRVDGRTPNLKLDRSDLRSMILTPINIGGVPSGCILTFGKIGGVSFSGKDRLLSRLLSAQISAAVEGCLLNRELRKTLQSTQLLYNLSLKISLADSLNSAAIAIAGTAQKLVKADRCGLILYSDHSDRQASSVFLPEETADQEHPSVLIQKSLLAQKSIREELGNQIISVYPIQTKHRSYGALWISVQAKSMDEGQASEEMEILVNQAAVALERSILLIETRQQAEQLESAYQETLISLMSALDARDRATEGHSKRVATLANALAINLGLHEMDLSALNKGALLHDIGKIGISDAILHKPDPLTFEEWQIMREHPLIGAHIVASVPFLEPAIPVIQYHHERWDGTGYPMGLKGEEIPLLARIFSVADVFDALLSDRYYHKKTTIKIAKEFIASESGGQFDPQVVQALMTITQNPDFLKELDYQDE